MWERGDKCGRVSKRGQVGEREGTSVRGWVREDRCERV